MISALIILLITVVLFVTRIIPSYISGLLCLILMVLFKICTFEEAFSGFSSSIVLLMTSSMIVGIAMFKTGVAQTIGKTVIKFAHGDEKIFLMASIVVGGLMAMFLANTAILASFIPIVDSVCSISKNMKQKNLILPIACAVMYGGACTLIGCTPQLTANGILSKMVGIEMGMWTLTFPGLIIFLSFILYIYFFGYKRSEKIWGDRSDEVLNLNLEEIESINKEYPKNKMILMSIICILMIISYIINIIPIAMTAMLTAILCIILKLITYEDIKNKLNLETIVFLATCLGIANALTVSKSGEYIGNIVSNLLGNITNGYIILAILTIITFIISQFITNSTAIIIVLPIAISLCNVYGFNHMPFSVAITFAGSFACLTPLAAAQITMTEVAGYEFLDYFKYGIYFSIITILLIVFVVPIFYPL